MKTEVKVFFCILIPALTFLSALSGAAVGNTALSQYPQALKAAETWQSDAVLTQISAAESAADGTSSEWTYSFYSQNAKSWYNVSARGEKIEGVQVGFGKTDGIGDPFIDSDKAMKEALAHGLKGNAPGMSLSVYAFGGPQEAYWMVSGGYETGDVTIWLEAKTGKLFRKNVIE